MSPLGRIMLLQDTGRRQRESQRLGYVGTAAFGCRRSEAPQGEATDSSYNPASYSLRFRMRIEYTLSVKDLLEAQGAQLGWPIRTLPFVGGLLILSGIGMFLQNPRQFGPPLGGIVIGAGLTFGLRILVSYSYKRDKRLHDRLVATPSDDGIEVSSSTGSSKFTWNAFTHQRETKSLFLLFQGPICVNIPKSGLSHDEALAFRKLIQENLSRGDQMDRKGLSSKTWIFIVVVSVAFVLMLLTIRNVLRQTSSQPAQTQSTN